MDAACTTADALIRAPAPPPPGARHIASHETPWVGLYRLLVIAQRPEHMQATRVTTSVTNLLRWSCLPRACIDYSRISISITFGFSGE